MGAIELNRPQTRCWKHLPGPDPTRSITAIGGAEMHSTRQCSVDHCERPSRALGMCKMHYNRHARGIPLDQRMPDSTASCTLRDCTRPYYGRGFCQMHYYHLRAHGDAQHMRTAYDPTPLPGEEWRPVVGFPGYEVSDLGRVRTIDRLDSQGRHRSGRIKAAPRSSSGHPRVSIRRDGKSVTVPVHQLVLAAFVGPRPEGLIACHNDGDPTNNTPENLRWDTYLSNNQDAAWHRVHPRTVRPALLMNGGHE